MNMGSIIREKRKALGFTLQEIGDVFGISRSAVASWERGDTRPDQDKLQALARKLKTSVQYLVTGETRYDLDQSLVVSLTKERDLDPVATGLNERLTTMIAEADVTQVDFAASIGVSRDKLTNWLLGYESIGLDDAIAIQQKYGYNPVWIMMGRGDPMMPGIYHDDPFDPIPIPEGRRIPVVGTAQLGDNGFWAELEYPVGHGDGYLDFPSRDKDAYGLRCKGDSMLPRIKDGEFVIIEPNRKVDHGDEVLVKAKDGRVMIKVYLYAAQGRTHFMSVNAAHLPIAIDSEQIERLHFVAAIVKPSMWLFG